MPEKNSRRESLKLLGTAALAAGIFACEGEREPIDPTQQSTAPTPLLGNVRHAASSWCYNNIPLVDLCRRGKEIGLSGVDLVRPDDWKTVLDEGLAVSMGYGTELGLTTGFNDPALHEQLLRDYRATIERAAEMGVKRLACFSGNRNGKSESEGLDNCARALGQLMPLAEERGIILCMETLNSKVDHPDYQGDNMPWCVELVERVGSPSFRLLYDIYHMQIMEGDIIRTIRKHHPYISHYHTGGNPGRNEINDSQELYYPAICKAIVETGFEGFIAQEFIPTREDRLESLAEAIRICDV